MKISIDLPLMIASFLSFLEKNTSINLTKEEISSDFENSILEFKVNQFNMRIIRDRGDWFFEFSSKQHPNEWYDVALIKEYICGKIDIDVLTMEEQIVYFINNCQNILTILERPISHDIFDKMEILRTLRVKRRLPKS